MQNGQIERILRLADPNIEIILVTMEPIGVDVLGYYAKMLELKGIKDADNRLHLIVPVDKDLTRPKQRDSSLTTSVWAVLSV